MMNASQLRIRFPRLLTDVNIFEHHCERQCRFAPTYSHRVGTAYSHRRNTHRTRKHQHSVYYRFISRSFPRMQKENRPYKKGARLLEPLTRPEA